MSLRFAVNPWNILKMNKRYCTKKYIQALSAPHAGTGPARRDHGRLLPSLPVWATLRASTNSLLALLLFFIKKLRGFYAIPYALIRSYIIYSYHCVINAINNLLCGVISLNISYLI